MKVSDPMTVSEYLAICAGMNVAIKAIQRELKRETNQMVKDYYKELLPDMKSGWKKFMKERTGK